MDESELLAAARAAFEEAYVPYSEYPVGAALRASDGTVYTGCNIENANYSNSLHAEEVALGKAVSDGARSFDLLAVASAAADGVTPCGMCRQSLAEFCDEGFEVVCDTAEEPRRYSLGELIPETITAAHLDAAGEEGPNGGRTAEEDER